MVIVVKEHAQQIYCSHPCSYNINEVVQHIASITQVTIVVAIVELVNSSANNNVHVAIAKLLIKVLFTHVSLRCHKISASY